MANLHSGARLQVDYFSAIQKFLGVALRTLPEMQVRRASAAWVLTNWQMRVRSHSSIYTFQRRLKLEDAQLSAQRQLTFHQAALVALQDLQNNLVENHLLPIAKVPQVVEILARFPVINVRQMSENAQVSEATAKRWLKAMASGWLLEEKYANGQNQYLNLGLLAIIDEHSKR